MFEVHKLNSVGLDKADKLRVVFQSALDSIEQICKALVIDMSKLPTLQPPNTRELSIVRTKLEEASFFAKRAMALCPENQDGG
jgi:hypothetical protein